MFDYKQYQRNYFMPPQECLDWAKKEYVDHAPIWCSVDLRDGNQALIEPMNLEEKLDFFRLLIKLGFKEIEVGFPAASETEYQLVRKLIDQNMIPQDVTIQVLTQAREHIIRKTFEAVKGAPNVIVHVYNSTSLAQREQVFQKGQEEIKQIAVEGATLLKELAAEAEGNILFEYSPESFTGTEVDYAVDVCNAVIDVWEPTPQKKAYINIPATVEMSMPHVFASQIEYVSKHLHNRDSIILSLHPHNDRGCGVSDAEMGLLAGADRIEGTLFGNGERTGNVDIIVLAMNMYAQGVDPKLDLSDMPHIAQVYERLTQMDIHMRHPYCGKLVFAAFSGSHQDAIAKRMRNGVVFRINSQSGKGGVAYVLEKTYGLKIPYKMREDLGYAVKDVSDKAHAELSPEEIYAIFTKRYKDYTPVFEVKGCHFRQEDGITATVNIIKDGKKNLVETTGNGRLNAVSNSFAEFFEKPCEIICYEEHALEDGSDSSAIAYVGIKGEDNRLYFGIGIDPDILRASIDALITAMNRSME